MTESVVSHTVAPVANPSTLFSFWAKLSRTQKILWSIAILWVVIHIIVLVVSIPGDKPTDGIFGIDVKTYFSAGHSFALHEPIYELGPWKTQVNFRYHPIYALLFSFINPNVWTLFQQLWVPITAIAYLFGIFLWYRVVCRLDPGIESRFLTYFPFAIVASDWLATLGYGNVTLVLVLLSGALALALVNENYVWAGIMTALIILMKPQWAFPLILPVILRDWKLLVRTMLVFVVAYALINVAFIVVAGPEYGLQTLQNYVTFLIHAPGNYPWQGQEAMFATNQDSIYQTWLRYFGIQAWASPVTWLCQGLLLLAFLKYVIQTVMAKPDHRTSMQLGLAFMFAGYAIATLMLSEIQDCTLGGLAFVYLISVPDKQARLIAWPIVLFVLFEIPGLVNLATGSELFDWPEIVPLRLIVFLLILWSGLHIVSTSLRSETWPQPFFPIKAVE